jgi:hypothetical protein
MVCNEDLDRLLVLFILKATTCSTYLAQPGLEGLHLGTALSLELVLRTGGLVAT